jgi:hypothetical protein
MTDISYGIGGFLKYQIGKIIVGLEYQRRTFALPLGAFNDEDFLYSGLHQDYQNPPTNTTAIINGQFVNYYELDRDDLFKDFNTKFSYNAFQLNIGIRLN